MVRLLLIVVSPASTYVPEALWTERLEYESAGTVVPPEPLFPVYAIVEVPGVNVPEFVNAVPVVLESVIVDAFAVRVPAAPIVSVVPLNARLVPSLVFKVPFTVIAPNTAESASIVTVCPAAIVAVSLVVGTCPQSHVPAVFQLPVARDVQSVGTEKFHPLPAVDVAWLSVEFNPAYHVLEGEATECWMFK